LDKSLFTVPLTVVIDEKIQINCLPDGKPQTVSWEKTDASIIANPINLNYRFTEEDKSPSRREAADPVLEYFKGKYYLFASKSGGYWSSPDLGEWTYIPCKSIATIEEYAPTILVLDDELYFMGSGGNAVIYKNPNPDKDTWERIDTQFKYSKFASGDAAFYQDDDGRVYLYWGCSDKNPIAGVEVDPKNGFKAIGEPQLLIDHHFKEYGWEEKGANNDQGKSGYNEGPCIIKEKGKYYLQYAGPGTEVRVYGDGIYTSDHPLGPYVYDESSPFSFKPGGFIGGAGHGHTFKDKYGNYWHVATMKISVRHIFERRLGLFPVYLSSAGHLHAHTALTDYPFQLPQGKANFEKNDLSLHWNLLSYHKKVTASSSLPEYEAEKANDEQVETWWSAQTGKAGEWWQIDLGKPMKVNALQINFADQDFTLRATNSYFNYQYYVEYSTDGSTWKRLIDRTLNAKDMPHELIPLTESVQARFFRITNTREMSGKFSISGFRIFGNGGGKAPELVSHFKVIRKEDRRRVEFNWDKVDNATGYIIRWGIEKNQLTNSTMVMGDNQLEAGYFNRDSPYYFSIDSFNENGITHDKKVYESK
jgi:hypothetical protein